MTFIPPILPKFSLEENVMVSVDGKTFPGVIKSLPFSPGGPYIVDCPSAHWPDFFYVSEESITKPNLEQPVKAVEKAVIEREPLQRKPIPSYSSYAAATSNIAALPGKRVWLVKTQAGFRRLYKHLKSIDDDVVVENFPTFYPCIVRVTGYDGYRYILSFKRVEEEISEVTKHLECLKALRSGVASDSWRYT